MAEEGSKNPKLAKADKDKSAAAGPLQPAAETLGEMSPMKGNGEDSRIVNLLARAEGRVQFRAQAARSQATRLMQAQKGLVHEVECIRDLVLMAAGFAEELPVGILVGESDTPPHARAVILLASILRQVKDLAKTSLTTIESQVAAIGELVNRVGEAAQGSMNLACQVGALAEEIRIDLPVPNRKHLVDIEVECLREELAKVMEQFQRTPAGASAGGASVVAPQSAAEPQLVN